MRFLALLFFSFSIAHAQEVDPVCLPAVAEPLGEGVRAVRKVFDSLAPECPLRTYPQEFNASNLSQLQREIRQKFSALGVNVEWSRGMLNRRRLGSGSWKAYENTPEDLERLRRLANIAYASFKVYPRNFLESSRLRTIYLAKDLVVSGQNRKAMPDPASRALLFGDNNDLVCDAGLELRIHHEFYHYLEGASNRGDMRPRSAEWQALNPKDFTYGAGGQEVYNCPGGFINRGHLTRGFMSAYALTAEEEDKAETFAWMMTRGYASRAQAFMMGDESLQKKRELILKYLKDNFSHSMDADYFKVFTENQ